MKVGLQQHQILGKRFANCADEHHVKPECSERKQTDQISLAMQVQHSLLLTEHTMTPKTQPPLDEATPSFTRRSPS